MGRKYYYPKKHKYARSGGGLVSALLSAFAGRRSHYAPYPPRRMSLKQKIVGYVLNRLVRKFLR